MIADEVIGLLIPWSWGGGGVHVAVACQTREERETNSKRQQPDDRPIMKVCHCVDVKLRLHP